MGEGVPPRPQDQDRLLREHARVLRRDAPSRPHWRSTASPASRSSSSSPAASPSSRRRAWLSLVKDGRAHVLPAHLTDEQLAAQVARIALIEEEARLDKRLAKIAKRRKQVNKRLAACARSVRLPGVLVLGEGGDALAAACRRPGPGW